MVDALMEEIAIWEKEEAAKGGAEARRPVDSSRGTCRRARAGREWPYRTDDGEVIFRIVACGYAPQHPRLTWVYRGASGALNASTNGPCHADPFPMPALQKAVAGEGSSGRQERHLPDVQERRGHPVGANPVGFRHSSARQTRASADAGPAAGGPRRIGGGGVYRGAGEQRQAGRNSSGNRLHL